jgi:hypothetical protein
MIYCKKLQIIILLVCSQILYAQEHDETITMHLSQYSFINKYLFAELTVENKSSHPIYVLCSYGIDYITETEKGIIVALESSWLKPFFIINNKRAMVLNKFHAPKYQEIKEGQRLSLSLLLDIPEKYLQIDNFKKIVQVIGIKYLKVRPDVIICEAGKKPNVTQQDLLERASVEAIELKYVLDFGISESLLD